MKTEGVTLTQEVPTTYARGGVIFMGTEDTERKLEQTRPAEESPEARAEEQDEKQAETARVFSPEAIDRKIAQWQQKFESKVKEITQQDLPNNLSTEELSHILKKMDEDVRRELLTEISEIARIDEQAFAKNPALAGMRRQLRDLLAEQQGVQENEIIQHPAAINEQLINQFGKFLGRENVRIVYEDQDTVSTHQTADGMQIISVPKNPNLQALIQIAQALHPERFSMESQTNMRQFAQDLQKAALLMDNAVFGADAIKTLYNTGAQLEHLLDAPEDSTLPVYELADVQRKSHQPISQQERTRIFLEIVMGRHPITSQDARGNIYDVYFQRWYRQLSNSNDPKDQDLFARWDGLSWQDKQHEYDEHLSQKKVQDGILRFLRPTIEKALQPGGKASRLTFEASQQKLSQDIFEGTIERWRSIVGEDLLSRVPELAERLHVREMSEEVEAIGLVEALKQINREFQPDEAVPPEFLDYVPAHLVDKLAAKDRDEAACVVAVAYEKVVLEKALSREDGTSQYVVVPELSGTHATLLVVDLENHSVIRVDPSAPRWEASAVVRLSVDDPIAHEIFKKIDAQFPEDTTEDFLYEPDVADFHIEVQREDFGGKIHTAISGDRLLVSALLGNMAALGGYLEANAPQEQAEAIRLAAAQEAVRIAPENPIAQELVKRLTARQSTKDLIKQPLTEEPEKQPTASATENLQDLLVGDWASRTPDWGTFGAFGGGPTPPEFSAVLNPMVVTGLNAVLEQDLEIVYDILRGANQAYRTSVPPRQDLIDFATARINELRGEMERRGKAAKIAQAAAEDGRMSVFNLRYDEITLFASSGTNRNVRRMKRTIEQNLLFVGKELNPGKQLPTSQVQIANGRFEDMVKVLNVNRDQNVVGARDMAENYSLMVINPAIIAAQLESSDNKQRIEAGGRAAQMDRSGGHDVYQSLQNLHGGRVGFIADRLWDVMRRWRLENTTYSLDDKGQVTDVSVPIITPAQYEHLREAVIEELMQEANQGRGRYAEAKEEVKLGIREEVEDGFIKQHQLEHNGNEPSEAEITAYMNTSEGQTALSEAMRKFDERFKDILTADANFAHTIFIMDRRSSAIGILGQDPDNFDPSSGRYVDGQDQDVQRYGMYTPAKRQLYHAIRDARIETYIRLRYGEDVLRILKGRSGALDRLRPGTLEEREATGEGVKRLDRFARQMGWDILAPGVKGRWENQFLYGRTDLYDLKRWRERQFGAVTSTQISAMTEAQKLALFQTQFGSFLRVLVADRLIKSPAHGIGESPDGSSTPYKTTDDVDPLTEYIIMKYVDQGVYGRLTQAAKEKNKTEEKDAYVQKTIRYGLMAETIAPFYPDELMKPFGYEPDYWTDVSGARFDPRFVQFFTSGATTFLETIPGARDEAEAKVKERFGDFYSHMGADARQAQIRFQIFQMRIAPTIASIRSMNMRGIDPNLPPEERAKIERGEHPRENPKQTNFGTQEYNDFGAHRHDVMAMMAAMTQAVTRTGGYPDHFGLSEHGWQNYNSLIGRLAFDPMMERVLFKSPLSIEDTPYWMLHGKDIYGHEKHPSDLVTLSNFGRWMTSVENSSEIRDGMVQLIRGANTNQLEETVFKPFEERVFKNIQDMESTDYGREDEIAVIGQVMRMMVAEGAELVGLEDLPLWRNSDIRKIFGKQMRAMSAEQAKSLYQSHFMQNLKPEYRAIMEEILFGKKFRRLRRSMWKIFYAIFIMTVTQAVSTGAETINEELRAA